MSGACPATTELDEFVHRPAARDDVATHVAGCPQCDKICRELKDDLTFERSTARLHEEVLSRPRIPGYEIIERLGEGGQAAVYKAIRQTDQKQVAIKIIPAAGPPSAEDRERFQREITVLSRCRHFHNIVQLYDHANPMDGQLWLVTECVNGLRITDFAAGIDMPERVRIAVDLCRAIHFIHELGFVYRDIKPANILVEATGRVVVLDMGVVQVSDAVLHWQTEPTMVGRFIGTLRYSAPEQSSQSPNGLDRRSDVYSLGVLIYQMLCGRMPYDIENASPDKALEIIRGSRPAPMNLEPRWAGLDAIVAKALEKDVDQRLNSARELAQALERASVSPSGAGLLPTPKGIRGSARFVLGVLGAIAGMSLFVFGVSAVVTVYYSQPNQVDRGIRLGVEASTALSEAKDKATKGDFASAITLLEPIQTQLAKALPADNFKLVEVRTALTAYRARRMPPSPPPAASAPRG